MITVDTNKILIPVDFSKTSMRAIKYAVAIARVTDGELFILNVQKSDGFLLDIILPALNLKDTEIIRKYLEEKLEKLAKDIRKEYKVKVTPLVFSGNITSEIVNVADKNKIGLIIMGTQGSDSSNDVFLG